MPKYTGQRKHSVFEDFEIEADNIEQAMDKLKDGFMLGTPDRVTHGEEYSGFCVTKDEDSD